jgi:hypothetical protein
MSPDDKKSTEIIDLTLFQEVEETAPIVKKEKGKTKVEVQVPGAKRNISPNRKDKKQNEALVEQQTMSVRGFTLLTKRSQSALDPVIVGCIYENKETGKFFLKVRKIFYLI